MVKDVVKSTARRLFAFIIVLLLVSQVAMSLAAWHHFKSSMLPEMDRKATTVGSLTRSQVERALDLGIPIDQLAGADAYFDGILKENPDIGYLALSTLDGRVLHASGIDAAELQRHVSATVARMAGRASTSWNVAESTPISAKTGDGAADFLDVAQPVLSEGTAVGVMHVGVDERFVRQRIDDIMFDIGIVLVTSLLVAFELLLFVSTLGLLAPMRVMTTLLGDLSMGRFGQKALVDTSAGFQRILSGLNGRVEQVNAAYRRVVKTLDGLPAARRPEVEAAVAALRQRFHLSADGQVSPMRTVNLVDVRMLTFLFMFGEFLSRPFFPLYVRSVVEPVPWMSDAVMMGLPITVFMLMHVLMTPVSARLIGQHGIRRTYILGAIASTVGLLGTGYAMSFYDLILWRMLSGAGYAIMFMACQAYVVAKTSVEERGQGIAMFVSGLMVAEVCAPAIGGILADRIGFSLVFALGAVIAAGSAFLAAAQLQADRPAAGPQKAARGSVGAAAWALTRNPRFMATVLFAAVPAKLLLTGFIFYLAPVYLTELGATQSEIGRYLMLYGLANVLMASMFARWADHRGAHAAAVFVGGALTGGVLLLGTVWHDPHVVLLAIAVIGVAQALSISAQLVLVSAVSRREMLAYGDAAVLAVFRVIERLGSAAGPLVVGVFVTAWGSAAAMAAAGVVGLVSIMVFVAIYVITRSRPMSSPGDAVAPVGGS